MATRLPPPPVARARGVRSRHSRSYALPRCWPAIAGSPECVGLLIKAGSSVKAACDGCPPLVMAVCIALHVSKQQAAVAIVRQLLDAGADPYTR